MGVIIEWRSIWYNDVDIHCDEKVEGYNQWQKKK